MCHVSTWRAAIKAKTRQIVCYQHPHCYHLSVTDGRALGEGRDMIDYNLSRLLKWMVRMAQKISRNDLKLTNKQNEASFLSSHGDSSGEMRRRRHLLSHLPLSSFQHSLLHSPALLLRPALSSASSLAFWLVLRRPSFSASLAFPDQVDAFHFQVLLRIPR